MQLKIDVDITRTTYLHSHFLNFKYTENKYKYVSIWDIDGIKWFG